MGQCNNLRRLLRDPGSQQLLVTHSSLPLSPGVFPGWMSPYVLGYSLLPTLYYHLSLSPTALPVLPCCCPPVLSFSLKGIFQLLQEYLLSWASGTALSAIWSPSAWWCPQLCSEDSFSLPPLSSLWSGVSQCFLQPWLFILGSLLSSSFSSDAQRPYDSLQTICLRW